MKIKKIPLKTPFVTALRRVEDVEFVRVEILFSRSHASAWERERD